MVLNEHADWSIFCDILAVLSATHLKKVVITSKTVTVQNKSTVVQVRTQNAVGPGTYVVTRPMKHTLVLDPQRHQSKINQALLAPTGAGWETETVLLDVHLEDLQAAIGKLSGVYPMRMQVLPLFKLRRGHNITIIYKSNSTHVILTSGGITIALAPQEAPIDTCSKLLAAFPVALLDACKIEAEAQGISASKLIIAFVEAGMADIIPPGTDNTRDDNEAIAGMDINIRGRDK